MKVEKCKKCGADVVGLFTKCAQCGEQHLSNLGCLYIFIAIVVFLIIVSVIISNKDSADKPSTQNQTLAPQNSNITNKQEYYIEVRTPTIDGLDVRKGPGKEYDLDDTGKLLKSEILYVLEEKNGWIRFRVTLNDVGWQGWVQKDLTKKIEDTSQKTTDDSIEILKTSGLLIYINPELNEAQVNPNLWNQVIYDDKQTYALIMAQYCADKKKNNLIWVTILDAYTGKKLAKYSQSWGFKVY